MTTVTQHNKTVKRLRRVTRLPLVMQVHSTDRAGVVEVSSETNADVWYEVDTLTGRCSNEWCTRYCKHYTAAVYPPLDFEWDEPVCKVCKSSPATHKGECRACYYSVFSSTVGL